MRRGDRVTTRCEWWQRAEHRVWSPSLLFRFAFTPTTVFKPSLNHGKRNLTVSLLEVTLEARMHAERCFESSKSPKVSETETRKLLEGTEEESPLIWGVIVGLYYIQSIIQQCFTWKRKPNEIDACVTMCPDLVSMLQGTGNTRIGPAEVGGDEGMIGKPPVAAEAAADWRGSWGSAVVTNAGGGTLKSTLKSRSYSITMFLRCVMRISF